MHYILLPFHITTLSPKKYTTQPLCLKKMTVMLHTNFIAHQLIFVIFGRDVADRVCYQMAISFSRMQY